MNKILSAVENRIFKRRNIAVLVCVYHTNVVFVSCSSTLWTSKSSCHVQLVTALSAYSFGNIIHVLYTQNVWNLVCFCGKLVSQLQHSTVCIGDLKPLHPTFDDNLTFTGLSLPCGE